MKKILFIVTLIFILFNFYKINELNYKKSKEIDASLVKHPENLPEKNFALQTSFWFRNIRADIYWLETIQYIWWNAVSSNYKKYLYVITDLITELNPHFKHPYIIAELLLPGWDRRALQKDDNYINQAEEIWLKWIKNFCDLEKINRIEKEDNLRKIWTLDEYKNPCKDYQIPYYLAYIYYFYKNDPLKSSLYYKVASASNANLDWIKIMAAIMQWKWWNREKSFFMFLNIAKTVELNNESCINFGSEMEKIWVQIFKQNIPLTGNYLKYILDIRRKFLWVFNEDKELEELSDTKCSNYVNKAIRELNLHYLEEANKKYMIDNNGNIARNWKALLNQWYINYLPIDFQQYETQWIIYEYNPDTKHYDYIMWNYDN